MTIPRRYLLFTDYLRHRFGERLQRVTLSGGLVCAHPDGREECPFCRQAAAEDPGYGRGMPPHEQIRRGVNFSRRHGDHENRLQVMLPLGRYDCAPIDHLRATLAVVAASENVAVMAVTIRPECVSAELARTLEEFSSDGRDVWLEIDGAPATWPIDRSAGLRLGVTVDLGLEPAVPPGNGDGTRSAATAGSGRSGRVEDAAALVHRLAPDGVGIRAPAVLEGTAAARWFGRDGVTETALDDFAERTAEFLERIPAGVAIHPLVLTAPSDMVVGPRWVLNRQRVEEAVTLALEARGTVQGERAGD